MIFVKNEVPNERNLKKYRIQNLGEYSMTRVYKNCTSTEMFSEVSEKRINLENAH